VHGLGADANTYAYVTGRTLSRCDPLGLQNAPPKAGSPGAEGWTPGAAFLDAQKKDEAEMRRRDEERYGPLYTFLAYDHPKIAAGVEFVQDVGFVVFALHDLADVARSTPRPSGAGEAEEVPPRGGRTSRRKFLYRRQCSHNNNVGRNNHATFGNTRDVSGRPAVVLARAIPCGIWRTMGRQCRSQAE
jgi:hypothetical protein